MIAKILNFLFPNVIESIKSDAHCLGRMDKDAEREQERLKSKNFELQRFYETGPVIVLCNEWQNPLIAKITRLIPSPYKDGEMIAEVKDYLTGKVLDNYGTMLPFTAQKLRALDKLSPDEICSFFYEGRYSWTEIYKNQNNQYLEDDLRWTGLADWLERMKANGFFKDYPEHQVSFYKELEGVV